MSERKISADAKERRKKTVIAALCAIMIIVLITAGTLSYFSDKQTLYNVFTVGDGVAISLVEPVWDEDHPFGVASDLQPGQVIEKDPTIHCLKNDCWVRMKIQLLTLEGTMITGWKAEAVFAMISGYSDQFTLDRNYSDSSLGIRYYNYDEIFTQQDGSKRLFSTVTIPDDWTDDDLMELGSFQIVVSAEAIQAAGFEDDPAAAFEALHGEWSAAGLQSVDVPSPSPTPTPTPTPSPSPTPTPTLSPTPSDSPTPTPALSPQPDTDADEPTDEPDEDKFPAPTEGIAPAAKPTPSGTLTDEPKEDASEGVGNNTTDEGIVNESTTGENTGNAGRSEQSGSSDGTGRRQNLKGNRIPSGNRNNQSNQNAPNGDSAPSGEDDGEARD